MAIACLGNGSASQSCIYFLIIIWTGCLFTEAIVEYKAAPPRDGHSNGCLLVNKTAGVKANCSNLSLTSIPDGLPPNTITLDASLNQIRVLQNHSFLSLQHLTALNVRENRITHIEVGAFIPLSNLRTLVMFGNMLSYLHRKIFDRNQLLSILVLSYNCLKFVPTEPLAKLPGLRKVLLNNNAIQTADFTAFSHSSNISIIELSGNLISSLQISDFKPLQNFSLDHLDLSHNMLQDLPARMFSYLYRVSRLMLIANPLKTLHTVSFLGHVTVGKLSVSRCKLQEIIPLNNSCPCNTTFPAIDYIDMTANHITSIPHYALLGFNKTKTLKLAGNKISNMFNDSFCGLESLTNLDLSYNHINFLNTGMFSCNPQLKELKITFNKISTLYPISFRNLLKLKKLDLSHNHFTKVNYRYGWSNPELLFLNLSHNQFDHISGKFFKILSNLSTLDVSYNPISIYSQLPFSYVPSLKNLFLISGKVLYLKRTFSHMKNLVKLDLSYAAGKFLNSTHQFIGTGSLEELRLCHSTLVSTDLFDNVQRSSLFDGLVSLENLNLRGNSMNALEPGVFRSLTKLKVLDLSRAEIVFLKPGTFKSLTSLNKLYLDENKMIATSAKLFVGLDHLEYLYFQSSSLSVLDMNTFLTTPHLHQINLSGNRLREVQKDTFFPTNGTLVIDISGNPLSCTCELSWFIAKLHTSNINLTRPNQTQCYNTSIKAVVGWPILMFDPTNFCRVNILLITSLSFFGVIVGFLCIIAYKRRWWLSYKLFLLKVAIIGHKEIAEDFNEDIYEFHLNLMFHEAEEEWVYRVLKPALEERMPHLQNVAYGDDSLELGVFYVNAIYAAIENSFKTVLLLSNQSINDAWFLTKLRMALEHLNDTRLNKVILIFVEDIDDNHLPYLVRLFLSRNKPYMLWTDDEDGQELFWAKFEKSMRANRALNNIIPV